MQSTKRSVFCLLSLLSLSSFTNAFASEPTADEKLFTQALEVYRAQQYEQSLNLFQNLLKRAPNDEVLLFNSGLAAYKMNKKGLAVAFWRKALLIHPAYPAAEKALKFAKTELKTLEPHSNDGTFQMVRSQILSQLGLNGWLFLDLVLILSAGWSLLNYLGLRKKALEDELPLRSSPWIALVLLILCTGSLILSSLKAYDLLHTWATVIVPTVEVRTGPSELDSSLISVEEGSEVRVRQSTKDWSQILFHNGTIGWVPNSSLFVTAGESGW